jgi:hypothetical protein
MNKMELPDDVLQLIREYAKPITRPDWRKLHIMKQYTLHNEFEKQVFKRYNRLESVYGVQFLQVLRAYKTIFDDRYFNNFIEQ